MIQIKSGEKILNNGQIHRGEKKKATDRNSEWNFSIIMSQTYLQVQIYGNKFHQNKWSLAFSYQKCFVCMVTLTIRML